MFWERKTIGGEVEYTVVIGTGELEAFIRDVNGFMQDRWRAQGGICVVVIGGKTWYFQAMYRKSELLPIAVRSGWMAAKKA